MTYLSHMSSNKALIVSMAYKNFGFIWPLSLPPVSSQLFSCLWPSLQFFFFYYKNEVYSSLMTISVVCTECLCAICVRRAFHFPVVYLPSSTLSFLQIPEQVFASSVKPFHYRWEEGEAWHQTSSELDCIFFLSFWHLFYFFLFFQLRYNWHVTLCKFDVC